jgi:hypothetical protein
VLDDDLTVFPVVPYLSGDMKARNQMLGIVTCFAGNTICCTNCTASQTQRQFLGPIPQRMKRTKEKLSANLLLLDRDGIPSPNPTGVLAHCPLDQLNYFSSAESYTNDAMHDIYEGFGMNTMRRLHTYWCRPSHRRNGLEHMQKLVGCFRFGPQLCRDKPAGKIVVINKTGKFGVKLPGTACQVKNYIRMAPLIYHDFVDPGKGDEHWELLLLLCTICDYANANIWRPHEFDQFDKLANQFIFLFTKLFSPKPSDEPGEKPCEKPCKKPSEKPCKKPSEKPSPAAKKVSERRRKQPSVITPKIHSLLHYSDNVRRNGPTNQSAAYGGERYGELSKPHELYF